MKYVSNEHQNSPKPTSDHYDNLFNMFSMSIINVITCDVNIARYYKRKKKKKYSRSSIGSK